MKLVQTINFAKHNFKCKIISERCKEDAHKNNVLMKYGFTRDFIVLDKEFHCF